MRIKTSADAYDNGNGQKSFWVEKFPKEKSEKLYGVRRFIARIHHERLDAAFLLKLYRNLDMRIILNANLISFEAFNRGPSCSHAFCQNHGADESSTSAEKNIKRRQAAALQIARQNAGKDQTRGGGHLARRMQEV